MFKKILCTLLFFIFFSTNLVYGYSIITKGEKKGVVNSKGNIIYKPIYQDISIIRNRYIIFQVSEDNYYMIDTYRDSKPIIRRAEYISPDFGHLELRIFVKNNEKYGVTKYNEKTFKSTELIPCIYETLEEMDNPYLFYIGKKNQKLGIINGNTGKEVTPIIYDEISNIKYSHYIKLKKNGKYALFNTETMMYTEVLFEDVRIGKSNAKENLQVKYKGKWIYLNKGKIAKEKAGQVLENTAMGIIGIVLVPITLPIIGVMHWMIYK